MKLTTSPQITASRFHRRSAKGNSYKKLFTSHQKSLNGTKRAILRETSPCDNSDDSGLGTDNNADYLYNTALPHPSVFRFAGSQKRAVDDSVSLNSKRHRLDGKEQHDLGESYPTSISHATLPNLNSVCVSPGMQTSVPTASKAIRRSLLPAKRLAGPVTLSSQLSSTSRNGKVSLQILNQPEQQHRARYQTEGSRGAVKDRTGNGFPVIKVVGYNRLTTLQVFIGSDQGRVTPHMFYQACRVTGKNSTPCVEKNIEGTIVIEIDIEPAKDMTVTCDCVGILKERNVDVEHRFPEECSSRSKKKSTRCRMVFRTVITNDDGSTETLQVASQPIACTQPPGIPEICKKSLTSCPASGGKELFILGKNFLKDTHVRFYTEEWEQTVTPDKEFLQQTHLVCVVPAYKNIEVSESVPAKVAVISGSRASESHTFTYTPVAPVVSPVAPIALSSNPMLRVTSPKTQNDESGILKPDAVERDHNSGLNKTNENIKIPKSPTDDCENVHPVILWPASNLSSPTTGNCSLIQNDPKMMPPPAIPPRRSSVQMIVPDNLNSSNIKTDVSNAVSGVLSHYSNAAGSQLPNSQRAYLPPQYPVVSDTPKLMPEYSSNYRTLSDIDATIKPDTVPKLEPLPEPSCADYQTVPDSDTRSMCVSNMKNSLAAIRTSQSSDLYSNSHSYPYSSADLYSKNEPKARSPIEDLSVFANPRPASALTSDSIGILSNTNAPNMMLSSTQNVNSNDGSNFVVSPSFQMSSVLSSAVMPVATRSSYQKNDKLLIPNFTDTSYTKRKTFQFDKLFDMKSQQSLNSCSLKNSASYENLNALRYKNAAPAKPNVLSVYQNYMNLENPSSLNTAEDVLPTYKLDENKSMATMDVINVATSLMQDTNQTSRKNSPDYTLSLTKTYTSKSIDGAENAYLNAQESVIDDFVNAPMVDNAINTVPKLEELVNCAAENHIRSANKSASSLNLLNDSNMNSNRNTPLNMFVTNESSQGGSCNGNAVSPTRSNVNETLAYQQSNSTIAKSPDTLEMRNIKEDKILNVSGMSKKTEDGVFSSEISQMTENDLLSYINPSCFDEVQR